MYGPPAPNARERTYYAYYLADLCHLIPSYQCKQRALSTIRMFFEALRLQLSPRYVLRFESSFCSRGLRKWANKEFELAGTTWTQKGDQQSRHVGWGVTLSELEYWVPPGHKAKRQMCKQGSEGERHWRNTNINPTAIPTTPTNANI